MTLQDNTNLTSDFKLIEGNFSAEDASKLLSTLINSKISYHNLEDFSNHIRFNNDLLHSKKRVSELNETKNKIQVLLDYAQKNNLKLDIKGNIEITFIK